MVSIYHVSTREAKEGGLGIQGQLGSRGKTLHIPPSPKVVIKTRFLPGFPQQWYLVYSNALLQSQTGKVLPHYPENCEQGSEFSSLCCGPSDNTHMNYD